MSECVCPECGRIVRTHQNRFGDLIFNRHKMATAWNKNGKVSEQTELDLQPGHDPSAQYTFEIDCPMSNQPLED